MFRQLSDGLMSGMPLPDLIAVIKRSSNAVLACGGLVDDLARASRGDMAVHEAMARQVDLLPSAGLVAEAEQLGLLPQAFDLLAYDWEDQDAWLKDLSQVLAWPAVLLACLFLLTIVIMVFVIPAFKEVFFSFGSELPGPTLFFLAVSELWVRHGALATVALGVAGWVVWRRRGLLMRSAWLDGALRRLPGVRAVIEGRFYARLGRMALLSAESHLPFASAVRYLGASTPLHGLAQDATRVAQALDAGLTPAEALQQSLPALGNLTVALAIAAHSAQPGALLLRVVLGLEQELRARRARLERAITLLTYVGVGSVLGIFVIAMYLPIFKLGAVV